MAKKRKVRKFELGFVRVNEKGRSSRKISGEVTRIRKTRKSSKKRATPKSRKSTKRKSQTKRKRK